MNLSKETIAKAISDLKGTAQPLLKVWLTLKAMGLDEHNSVLVDTKNSTRALNLLYYSGDPSGRFYIPFSPTPSDEWMKSDASRSIIQTTIKKWFDGKITTVDPRSYLKIESENKKYKVSQGDNYPNGLGQGPNGFARSSQQPLAVPMVQFAVWVFCRETIPDTEVDVKSYLCNKLRALLHLAPEEEHLVFANDTEFEISMSEDPVSDNVLYRLCGGVIKTQPCDDCVYQRITYGAPGTGKSHKISAVANENNSIRVTFHPDTDYSAFIGAYKPTMERAKYDTIIQLNEIVKDANGVESVISKLKAVRKDEIVYSFVPQAFMKAYVEAWRRWCDGNMSDDDKVFYLVIEEINRGNCAQIFGDAFQLLDRCANGFSSYAIAPDHDIERFLHEDKDWNLSGLALTADVTNDDGKVVATAAQIKRGERMALPPNFRIWATMNTSDQSLFPMDSAFKRRWDWEYMPIKDEGKGWKIRVGAEDYEWWSFLNQINDEIAEYTSSEDKQLGYFFARPKDGGKVIDTDDFVSKVIFYLWKDVFKDDLPQTNPFKYKFKEEDPEREIRFTDFYKDGLKDKLVKHFLEKLGVKKVDAQTEQTAAAEGTDVDAEGAATQAV